MLGYTPFPERAAVPVHRLLQAFSGPSGQHCWVMELAQPCKGMNPRLAARERVSGSYSRLKSHSSMSLNFSLLPYSFLKVQFSAEASSGQLAFYTHLPKIAHLVRIFLLSPFNSDTAEKHCPNYLH